MSPWDWCLAPVLAAGVLAGPGALLVPCEALAPGARQPACSLVAEPGRACLRPVPRAKPEPPGEALEEPRGGPQESRSAAEEKPPPESRRDSDIAPPPAIRPESGPEQMARFHVEQALEINRPPLGTEPSSTDSPPLCLPPLPSSFRSPLRS